MRIPNISLYFTRSPNRSFISDWEYIVDPDKPRSYHKKHALELIRIRSVSGFIQSLRDKYVHTDRWYMTYKWHLKYNRKPRVDDDYRGYIKTCVVMSGWTNLMCGIAFLVFFMGTKNSHKVTWKKGKDIIKEGQYKKAWSFPFKQSNGRRRSLRFRIRVQPGKNKQQKNKELFRRVKDTFENHGLIFPCEISRSLSEELIVELYYTHYLKYSYDNRHRGETTSDFSGIKPNATKLLEKRKALVERRKREAKLIKGFKLPG